MTEPRYTLRQIKAALRELPQTPDGTIVAHALDLLAALAAQPAEPTPTEREAALREAAGVVADLRTQAHAAGHKHVSLTRLGTAIKDIRALAALAAGEPPPAATWECRHHGGLCTDDHDECEPGT